ncbi:7TM GPCR domain containing protein [Aphelenchoides besseyi]|nr:7TM GPCR domain containing protein [Aphelenchoides besseyi]KAI6236381.1 7TM GPCR domain containing protein [Aphelenchoides besseyi]
MTREANLRLRSPMSINEGVSYAITLILQPSLIVLGTILNLCCIAAFVPAFTQHQQYYRKTSLLIYLIAMSVCNSIQLSLSAFVIVLPAVEQFIDEQRFPSTYQGLLDFNKSIVYFSYPLLMSANYASIWILTLICAQRYQSICHPSSLWKRRLQIVRKSKFCVTIAVVLALVFNFPRYWELKLNKSNSSTLRESFIYKIAQEGIIYGCVVYGLPMGFLLWLNLNTIRIVKTENDQPRRPAEHRTALMTITVFVLFFFCTTLSVSLRLILIFGGTMLGTVENIYFVDLSNLLANLCAFSMPVVCFIYTRAFRDLFFVVRFVPAKTQNDEGLLEATHQLDAEAI